MHFKMAAKLFILFLALGAIQSAYSATSISFRWCATKVEMDKCRQFIQYVNETAQNKSLPLKFLNCVEGSSYDDCATKIKENKADLVTLDGGRVYAAGKNNGLVPIVAEIYGQYKQKYYAVAVVKKNNTGFGLEQLKGKKSCHTGARKTAGWNVPIGYMLRKNIIPPVKCDTETHDFYSVANFFNQSCVPGVKEYVKTGEVPDKLCALCDGPGPDKCSKNPSENKYYDYHGAFMCMADGKGDVAFVKHATTKEVVTKDPGKYGAVSDYQYLCKDGTRKDIGQHEQCFLGFNPAHAVVTRKDNYLDDIVTILTAMSSMYGSSQTDWTKFQLFNSTKYGGANLLFKDSSTELVGISKDKRTYKGYLADEYVSDIEALKTCDMSATTKESTSPTSDSTKTTPYAVIVLFVALLAVLLL